MRSGFQIGETTVPPGEHRLVDLPVSKLSNHLPITLPVHVLHGAQPGPAMFVSAAIHGDELNGVEIIRRILRRLEPATICGTLLLVPVVNGYGFIGRSRYLPDRRDLNRSFPGSPTGSLAARLAHLFMQQVVRRCQIGIDLHTAAVHRINLPQIRAAFADSPQCRSLVEAFGAQIALESPERPGSLREAARERGVDVLVYEGGEGLRFDEFAIDAGVDGVMRVMEHIGMRDRVDVATDEQLPDNPYGTVLAHASKWVRAADGGVFRATTKIGKAVSMGERIGFISSPFEDREIEIRSPHRGIVIGSTTLPVVNMGDALFHIAWSKEHVRLAPDKRPVPAATEGFGSDDDTVDPVMDEDEIL